MPVIGWSAGLSVRELIEVYDHWVAFGLLAFVGGKMINDAFSETEKHQQKSDPTKGSKLVLLSVATSIDALAVGLSLSIINVSVWGPALIIGITAALFTVLGLFIGSTIGRVIKLSQYAEVVGGIVLFLIGINILYEHGVLSGLIG